MTATPPPITKHIKSAKEHLAGLKAAAAFRQELAARHLLRTQSPISREPIHPEPEAGTAEPSVSAPGS